MAQNPERFVVADVKWTGGTEQMLDAVHNYMQGVCGGSSSQEADGGSCAVGAEQEEEKRQTHLA